MTTLLPQTNTLYQAGSGNSIGATTVTLTSLTDIYGNVLTMSDFGSKGFITLEPDTNNEESATFTGITANGNGTYTLTGVKTVLAKSPYTETSGLIRQHAGGTKVVITDTTALWNTFVNKNNDSTILGKLTLTSTQKAIYDTDPTITDDKELATKKYVDDSASAGAADASTTVKGISKLDTAPASSTNPIAVGVNSALFNTKSTTTLNGTSNKLEDEADTGTTGANKLLRLTSGGKVTTSTIDTGTGANQIVKLDASAKLPAVDGSQLTNVVAYKNGIATYDLSTASGTQTIAHGLGKTPKKVKLTGFGPIRTFGIMEMSWGCYDGTNNSCLYYICSLQTEISNYDGNGSSTTYGIYIYGSSASGEDSQKGVITVDATNITITWTKTNSPSGTANIMWEVEG